MCPGDLSGTSYALEYMVLVLTPSIAPSFPERALMASIGPSMATLMIDICFVSWGIRFDIFHYYAQYCYSCFHSLHLLSHKTGAGHGRHLRFLFYKPFPSENLRVSVPIFFLLSLSYSPDGPSPSASSLHFSLICGIIWRESVRNIYIYMNVMAISPPIST